MSIEYQLPKNYITEEEVKFVLDLSRNLPSQKITKARGLQRQISEINKKPIEQISIEEALEFLKSELKNNNIVNVTTVLNCFPKIQEHFYQNGGVIYPEKDQTLNIIFTNHS